MVLKIRYTPRRKIALLLSLQNRQHPEMFRLNPERCLAQESNVPDSSGHLSGPPIELHFHWNTPEPCSLEALKARCSLAVPLYRTLEYNEVSGLIGTNLLRIELCFGSYQQLIIGENFPRKLVRLSCN